MPHLAEDILSGLVCRYCQAPIAAGCHGVRDLQTCRVCRKILAGEVCQLCLAPVPPQEAEPQTCDDCLPGSMPP